MSIKRTSKMAVEAGNAAMTDLMFLLLIFMMVAMTMLNNNALQISLPKSSSPTQDKPTTSISITADSRFFLDDQPVDANAIEGILKAKLAGQDRPIVFLYADKRAPWEEVVKIMNIAKHNNYNLSAATAPE